MKIGDRKKLWVRSGNICGFPQCGVELANEENGNRVTGVEAHIKGEKPTAPRYDPNQSDEERDSYENRILLCPNHHAEIDNYTERWTVERLQQIKKDQEQKVVTNRQYPELRGDLKKLAQKYEPSEESPAAFYVEDVIENAGTNTVRVDASIEAGINTNIKLQSGQRVAFLARGLISYDSGHHFTTPEGILCNEYSIPFIFLDKDGKSGHAILLHPDAYKTDGGKLGRIGSLIGWINKYTEETSFLIGSKREIEAPESGTLFLKINDAQGTYGDNNGEFRVDIRIIE